MSAESIFLIILTIIVLVAIGGAALAPVVRRARLRERFGSRVRPGGRRTSHPQGRRGGTQTQKAAGAEILPA